MKMTVADGLTMSANADVAVFVPSLTITVIGATPICPAVGLTVTVRLLPLPPKTMFILETSAEFDENPDKVRTDAGLSASPTVKAMPATEELTRQFVAEIVEMTGAVFAGNTVTMNERLFDFPPVSITQTVMVDDPT